MVLQYLWIEQYRNIVRQGFNFGGPLYFQLEEREGQRFLKAHENPKFVPNLYQYPPSVGGESQIQNLTAIVGENGAGKTNLLSFLLTFLNRPIIPSLEGNQENEYWGFLAVFFNGDELDVYDSIGLDGWIDFNSKEADEDGEAIVSLKSSGQTYNCWERSVKYTVNGTPAQKLPCTLFYSPIVDWRPVGRDTFDSYVGGIDVSTNFLVHEDYDPQQHGRNASWHNALLYHPLSDVKRQLKFTIEASTYQTFPGKEEDRKAEGEHSEQDSLLVDIPLPDQIALSMEWLTSQSEEDETWNVTDAFKPYYKALKNILLEHTRAKRNEIAKAKNKGDLGLAKQHERSGLRATFMHRLFHALFHNLNNTNAFLDNSFSPQYSVTIALNQLDTVDPRDALQIFLENQNLFRVVPILDLMQEIDRLLSLESTEVNFEQKKIFVQRREAQRFISVYESYLKCLEMFVQSNSVNEVKSFIDFDWRDVSSGEKAYLNLFSRLNYGKENLVELYKNSQNHDKEFPLPETLYIIIDEGELGFHLQWQKAYVKRLVQILPQIFADVVGTKPTLQVILTSHSPVSLSDLPRYNILYLEKDFDAHTCNVLENDPADTDENPFLSFGANIFDLVKDSFFMREGFIGDFVKATLNDTIKWLNEPEGCENLTYHERIIELVDEPTLKAKLKMMLKQKECPS